MKLGWTVYLLCVFLAIVIILALVWIQNPLFVEETYKFSPVPSFLTLTDNPQVTTLDIWQPEVLGESMLFPIPTVTAVSGLVYDLATQRTLFDKNSSLRVPMASLTKIMTAIVALEHKKSDDMYMVQGRDLVGEDSMGLVNGEALDLKELLYGLILHSGNDAAEVLADNFSGGREAFIESMNLKAQSLGLMNTHFTNPTGLEGDGKQFTTARDLLIITEYALSHFPLFDEVVSTFDYTIPATNTHAVFYLENETNLLSSYPGVKGVKTGYTPEAGLCLVTYLEYGGHRIIAVLLGSENRRQEMKDLLDYSLRSIGVIPPRHG